MREISKRVEIRKETWEEADRASMYNRRDEAVIPVKDSDPFIVKLSAGESDDVHIFMDGDGEDTRYYILSFSRRMGYVGLAVYAANGNETGDVFLQSEDDWADVLGKRGLDLSPATMVKRLMEYCE